MGSNMLPIAPATDGKKRRFFDAPFRSKTPDVAPVVSFIFGNPRLLFSNERASVGRAALRLWFIAKNVNSVPRVAGIGRYFQVLQAIVKRVAVKMIDALAFDHRTQERLRYEAMNGDGGSAGIDANSGGVVALAWARQIPAAARALAARCASQIAVVANLVMGFDSVGRFESFHARRLPKLTEAL